MKNSILKICVFVISAAIFPFSSVMAQGAQVFGKNPSLAIVPIQTDASGNLLTTPSGYAVGATYTCTPLSIANVSATIIAVNANRKALIIQNNSTLYNLYVANISPATSTNGLTLIPGASWTMTTAVPLGAWYGLGANAVADPVTVCEGQ